MRKAFAIGIAFLFLLAMSASCSKSSGGKTRTESDGLTEPPAQSDALRQDGSDLTTVNAHDTRGADLTDIQLSHATRDAGLTDIQLSDLGYRLFSYVDESTWAKYPLYAVLEEEDIYLYGSGDYGYGDVGMILRLNGRYCFFDWPGLTPRGILPQMMVHDFDGDGAEELAVLLYVESGTGVAMMDCHVLSIMEDGNPVSTRYADYSLLANNISEWMTAQIYTQLADDGETFRLYFAGNSYTIECHSNDDSGVFTGVSYGHIVGFEFDGARITTTIAVGSMYENYATPQFFGEIKAVVVFDGERFTFDEYTFA